MRYFLRWRKPRMSDYSLTTVIRNRSSSLPPPPDLYAALDLPESYNSEHMQMNAQAKSQRKSNANVCLLILPITYILISTSTEAALAMLTSSIRCVLRGKGGRRSGVIGAELLLSRLLSLRCDSIVVVEFVVLLLTRGAARRAICSHRNKFFILFLSCSIIRINFISSTLFNPRTTEINDIFLI